MAKAVVLNPSTTGAQEGIQIDIRDYGKDSQGKPKRLFGYTKKDKDGKEVFTTTRGVCRGNPEDPGNAYAIGVGGQGPGAEVIGTFLHELEHAAARSVFQNGGIPYSPYSKKTKEIIEGYLNPIFKLADKWGSFPEEATEDNPTRKFIFRKDLKVPEVFKNMSGYNKKQWIKEMIVRPGQARVDRDRNEEYFELLNTDPDLRALDNFWEGKFISRMEDDKMRPILKTQYDKEVYKSKNEYHELYDSDCSGVSSKASTHLSNVSRYSTISRRYMYSDEADQPFNKLSLTMATMKLHDKSANDYNYHDYDDGNYSAGYPASIDSISQLDDFYFKCNSDDDNVSEVEIESNSSESEYSSRSSASCSSLKNKLGN